MRKSGVRRKSGLKTYRFVFPRISNCCRNYTIETLEVAAKNKKKAKKIAVDYLKKYMGAAINAISPEQAVRAAEITRVARDVEITVIGRWPKKNWPKKS